IRLVLEDQRDLGVQLRRADRPGQPAPAHPLHLAAPAVRRHLADLLDQLPRAHQWYPAVQLDPVVLAHLAVQQGQQVLEARLGLLGPEDLEDQQEGHCTLRVPTSPGERRSLGIGALAGPYQGRQTALRGSMWSRRRVSGKPPADVLPLPPPTPPPPARPARRLSPPPRSARLASRRSLCARQCSRVGAPFASPAVARSLLKWMPAACLNV